MSWSLFLDFNLFAIAIFLHHKVVKTIYIHSKDARKDFQMQQNQAIFITWYIKVAYADKKYSQDCIF